MSDVAERFLEEVNFDDQALASQIMPAGKASPVRIEPGVAFGAPHVQGIRTENLVGLVNAWEEIDIVAESFHLTETDLRAALAYEWQAA